MTDEVDEVKVFRKTDKEEAADGDIDQEPLAGDAVPNYPASSNATGSLMPSGLATGALAPFSPSIYFSPNYSPIHPMMQPFMMTQSPAYANILSMAYNMQMAANANNNPNQQNATTPKNLSKLKNTLTKENRENHKDRIKKPLNAFMIFMREMRPKLLQEEEFANMQSAELNRELGKRWTALDEAEQKVYFEKYKQGKEEHLKMYPGWSARDNYTVRRKKAAERKPVQTVVKSYIGENNEPKKCRALYGVNNQAQWCRHCKRKKRCLLVRPHDNDDNSSSRDTSPTTPLSNVDLPDVHNPQPGPAAPPPSQLAQNMPLSMPFGNLNINEHGNQQHPNIAHNVKVPQPPPTGMPAPPPQQPMMPPFGMPFPMYPFGFPQFMGMQMPQQLMSPGMGGAPIKADYRMAPPLASAEVKP